MSSPNETTKSDEATIKQRRWHLALGTENDSEKNESSNVLSERDQRLSKALDALYANSNSQKGRGSLNRSAPTVSKWLGDIRDFFPSSVVQVVQRDAFERLGLKEMLLEPEFLAAIEADVHLVADLISLRSVIPEKTKDTARQVVQKVVDELMKRLEAKTAEAIRGAINRSKRTFRPRFNDIKTQLICFDTAIVDMTEDLADPVSVLFGVQLGGGTDIDQAVAYCADKIERPSKTHLVLITDLYEGGDANSLKSRVADLIRQGVNVITLLALSDEGRSAYDANLAADFAAIGCPVFACTPDQFPDLMATALKREDVLNWAANNDIKAIRASNEDN